MNERDENPVLIEVAITIADGLPVDWESLLAEHPDIAEDLRELQVLQGVEEARRRAGRERRGRRG
jgi:hypothetical protein